MNGKAQLVQRVLEVVRQRQLTNRLGQVVCEDSSHGPDIAASYPCLGCGAVL